MSRQNVQYYKGSSFYGDWTQEEMEDAIKMEKEMWEAMNDPANEMTAEEHLNLTGQSCFARDENLLTDFTEEIEKLSLEDEEKRA